MKFKTQIIYFLLCTIMISKTLKEYKEDFCEGIAYKDLETSLTDYEDLREERRNPFHKEYVDLIKFLHGEEGGDAVDATLPYFVLLFFFLIFVFVLFVFSILVFFGVFKKRVRENKIFGKLFCVFLFFFFVMFVVFCVFLGLMINSQKKGLCIYYRTVYNLLEGDPSLGDSSFLGLFTMEKMDQDFMANIPKIPEMDTISKKILSESSETKLSILFTELTSIEASQKASKTSNMSSLQKTPFSVQNLTQTINEKIGSEFHKLSKASNSLTKSAESSLSYSNPFYQLTSQSVFMGVNQGYQVINSKLRESFIDRIDENYAFTDYAKFGNIFVVIFICILLILFFVMLFGIFKKNKFSKKIFLGIFVLSVFFLLVATVTCFFVLFGSAGFSGFCEYAARINRGETDVLEKVEAIDSISLMTLTCFLDTSQGTIIENMLMKNEILIGIYNNYRGVINGVKDFELYEENNKGNLNSAALDDQIKNWEEIQNGFLEDHKDVNENLEQLNDLISCSDKKFEISKTKCLSETNCLSILETETFTPPSCSSDSSQAQIIFQKLKKYADETNKLINNLKASVGSKDTPNTLYETYSNIKNNLLIKKDEVLQMKNNLKSTFNYIEDYKSDFNTITDCRNLRRETLRLEDIACFKFSYYYYIFLVVTIVLLVLSFFMLVFMLFFNLQEGEVVEQETLKNGEDDKKFYKSNTEEQFQINDTERMPDY